MPSENIVEEVDSNGPKTAQEPVHETNSQESEEPEAVPDTGEGKKEPKGESPMEEPSSEPDKAATPQKPSEPVEAGGGDGDSAQPEVSKTKVKYKIDASGRKYAVDSSGTRILKKTSRPPHIHTDVWKLLPKNVKE